MRPWLQHHSSAAFTACQRLLDAPLNTFLALLVIGIALTLPATGFVLLDNVRDLGQRFGSGQQISIFMAPEATSKEVADIEANLQAQGNLVWHFISREEALRQLRDAPGMQDVLGNLKTNPLPDTFVIHANELSTATQDTLVHAIKTWPKVVHVQQDAAWARRLEAFLHVGKTAILLLGGIFAAGLVAITFNTIRLQVMGQAVEVEVARLIGATDAFIARPFLYFGFLQGLLGGLLAAALAGLGVYLLAQPVAELAAQYGDKFVLRGPELYHVLLLAIAGAVLGWLGARLSVALFLREKEH